MEPGELYTMLMAYCSSVFQVNKSVIDHNDMWGKGRLFQEREKRWAFAVVTAKNHSMMKICLLMAYDRIWEPLITKGNAYRIKVS